MENLKSYMGMFKISIKNPLIVILFLVMTVTSCKQKKESVPEVLLVGTFHQIADSLNCNWQNAYQKILRYKPDQIAVEYNHPHDSISHVSSMGRNWSKRLDSLKLLWDGRHSSTIDSLSKYERISQKKEDLETRLQLWKYYYLNADFGNRDYQSYLIHMESNDDIKSLNTSGNFDSLFQKRHQAIVRHRKESEFFNLVFPLAYNLNIAYVAPTDNKSTYAVQSDAYVKWSEGIKDSLAWKKYNSLWNDFNQGYNAKLVDCNALEFVNSEDFLKRSDFLQAHIFDDLNNEDFKAYTDVWYKRNGLIGDNIIKLIETKNAKKVAAFYGFMHVYPVKKYLEEKGYKVKLLGHLD